MYSDEPEGKRYLKQERAELASGAKSLPHKAGGEGLSLLREEGRNRRWKQMQAGIH